MLLIIASIKLVFEIDEMDDILQILLEVIDEIVVFEILLQYDDEVEGAVIKVDVTDEVDEDDECSHRDEIDAENQYGT